MAFTAHSYSGGFFDPNYTSHFGGFLHYDGDPHEYFFKKIKKAIDKAGDKISGAAQKVANKVVVKPVLKKSGLNETQQAELKKNIQPVMTRFGKSTSQIAGKAVIIAATAGVGAAVAPAIAAKGGILAVAKSGAAALTAKAGGAAALASKAASALIPPQSTYTTQLEPQQPQTDAPLIITAPEDEGKGTKSSTAPWLIGGGALVAIIIIFLAFK